MLVGSPYLFLKRDKNIELLTKRIGQLSVDVVDVIHSDTAYAPARVELSCPWASGLAIIFRRRWWADGTQQEDGEVLLAVEGAEAVVLDIGDLLRVHHAQPLADVIVERLYEAVASESKKRQLSGAPNTSLERTREG